MQIGGYNIDFLKRVLKDQNGWMDCKITAYQISGTSIAATDILPSAPNTIYFLMFTCANTSYFRFDYCGQAGQLIAHTLSQPFFCEVLKSVTGGSAYVGMVVKFENC